MGIKKTLIEFCKEADIVHSNFFTYTNSIYINCHTKICITCPIHGSFLQTPANHLSGQRCPRCHGHVAKSVSEYVSLSNQVHDFKYNYSLVHYTNIHTPVKIICPIHGIFEQTFANHITYKTKCPTCSLVLLSEKFSKGTERFKQECSSKRGDKYDYSKVEYINNKTPVTIICKIHGEFDQLPKLHLNRASECPKCAQNNKSKKALCWLKKLIDDHGIDIQHIENGGEFKIPGTRYKADGYCKENNTVYEFYGNYWHGNPNMSTSDLAVKRYNKTKLREKLIISKGFNVVSIWEQDYDAN